MNMKWKDMTSMQKSGFVILCIGAVLMVLGIAKPDLFPVNMTTPALVIMSVGETMDHWEKQRKWAWLFAGAGIICLACFVLELCLL